MEMTQEVFMIALIPGVTSALTSLQPQPAASPAPQDGFPRLLELGFPEITVWGVPGAPGPAPLPGATRGQPDRHC
jgi:hypothetical protein